MNPAETLKTRDHAPVLLWLIWVPWLLFFTPAVVSLFQLQPPLWRLIVTLVAVAFFFALYLWATWRNVHRRVVISPPPTEIDRLSWLVIGTMTVSCLILPLLAGDRQGDWLDPFILTSAYVGGRLPTVRAAQTMLGLVLVEQVGGLLLGFTWIQLGQALVYIVVVCIVVNVLVRVITTGRELRTAREEIARLAAQAERQRLSRDLHDSVKQQIFAVSLQIGTALSQIEQDREAARRHLVEAETLVYQAQQDLTALIQDLRPSVLEEKGLPTALHDFVTTWSRQNAILAEAHIAQMPQLPHAVEEALWRVAQEALSNIVRHSQASKVHLRLDWTPDEARLSLTDNGRGFDPASCQKTGVGLSSIHERIEALGGNVFFESRLGEGTRLVVRCPLPPKGPGVKTDALPTGALAATTESEARA
jgi:signal transduction histidine kinase